MELLVTRTTRTPQSTTGRFSVNGNFFSYCLEPTDRGLTADMTLTQINAIKVLDKTCVPAGRYQVTSYFSQKNNRDVPLIENIPGYAYVEIHQGNYPADTDGCLLLGSTEDVDFIGNSDVTVNQFYTVFFEALNNGEQIFITYQ